ncbi:MAG TPA: MerR family transcriptional regulator [Chloroflexota bacterium]|nr:MerR family transcriptional regulator [Chloroflexota bacterium]
MDPRDALFIISVASRLVEMHPSTLRKYERCGMLEPCRMSGRLRLYSPEDIARLRQIKTLVEERGVNLAGVRLALALTEQIRELSELTDSTDDPETIRHDVRARLAQMLNLLGVGQSADEPGADRHPTSLRN